MSLVLGQRMVRLEDGTRGTVALVDGERRITWQDRGEVRVASRQEVWEPEAIGSRKLRREEMLVVAECADRGLEALERHEPFRHWEIASQSRRAPYDQGLIDLIVAYLEKKQ